MNKLALLIVLTAAAAVATQAITVPGEGGYITVDETTGADLWYWFFEAKNLPPTAADTPFVLWLTGGPGCSGSLAALSENGPYTAYGDGEIKENPYGWNNNANLLYLDQPYGVGFSNDPESDYINNTVTAAADVCAFLQKFFTEKPEYAKQPFFVSAESYGGHWAPAVTAAVLDGCGAVDINIQGMSIGNGMVDPELQFPGYSEYAAKYNLVSADIVAKAQEMEAECVATIKAGELDTAYEQCLPIIEYIVEHTDVDGQGPINVYQRNIPCDAAKNGPLCYDFSASVKYLNNPEVQAALNVKPGITWATCNYNVNAKFTADWVTSYNYDLVKVVKSGIRVIIYNGQLDYICNYIGATASAKAAAAATGNNLDTMHPWSLGSTVVGSVAQSDNFSLVYVAEAGHLVPYNQPAAALVIVDTLTTGAKWNVTSA